MTNRALRQCLVTVVSLVGVLGCKDRFHVGTSNPDGASSGGEVADARTGVGGGSSATVGSGGIPGTSLATGGRTGTGGSGGTGTSPDAGPVADALRTPADAPATEPDGGAADVPMSRADVPGGSICLLPKDVGNCDGVCRAYWYNQATGRCESFDWGCCGGNANNFETLAACVSTCEADTGSDASTTEAGRAGLGGAGGTGGGGGLGGTGGTTAVGGALGMTCTGDKDCPTGSTCCDGSDPSCDGTRLPAGDKANPGELVVSADGLTVADTMTGLTWQRDGSGARAGCSGEGSLRCTWTEAQAYCASLELGGVGGWRLPTWSELLNITDLTTDATTPPIDQIAFPGTPMEDFWTSSRPASSTCSGGIYVDFSDATLRDCSQPDLPRVRCVRGSRCYPKSRFVVLDTEAYVDGAQVRDTLTGLIWQQLTTRPLPTCRNWAEAQSYCSSLGSGFRLPTLKELDSLIASGLGSDRTYFLPDSCDYTWTSSPYGGADASLTGYARYRPESYVMLGKDWNPVTIRWGVRCVR